MPSYSLSELLARIEANRGPDGLDLADVDLSGLDASPAALQAELARAQDPGRRPRWLWEPTGGLNLHDANLEGANLAGANLTGANLRDSDLDGAHLAQAKLEEAILKDVELEGTNLEGASLARADLQGADLESSNLSEANLSQANLRDADLGSADLKGANLSQANLRDADLAAANLAGAHLRGANLRDANLENANLSAADLEGANLQDANLEGAHLVAAHLRGANLREADLGKANLQGADLEGANLEGTILEGTARRSARRHQDRGFEAHLDGAELAETIREAVRLGVQWGGEEEAAGEAGPAEAETMSLPRETAILFALELGQGHVDLSAEERDDISIRSASRGLDQLLVERSPEAIRLRQVPQTSHGWLRGRRWQRLNLQIALPRAIERLEIKTGLGSILGRQLDGEVALFTGKGDIRCQECNLHGQATSGYGGITLAAVQGAATVKSGCGDLRISCREGTRLSATSGNGSVEVEGELAELSAKSGAGGIVGRCDLGPGTHRLSTGAGPIDLELGEGQSAQVDASTGMGQIQSDWPLVRVGRPGPVATGSGRMVGSFGDELRRAVLYLKTGVGDIHLRRRTGGRAAVPAEPRTAAAPPVSPVPPVPPVGPLPPAAPEPAVPPSRPLPAGGTRMAILESLARHEITIDEAERMLLGFREGEDAESPWFDSPSSS